MTSKNDWMLAWLLLAPVALTGCSGTSANRSGADPAEDRPAVAVEVQPAATADLDVALGVVGSLAPKFFAEIKSEITSTVSAVYVTEWVRVKKGTLLARLDQSESQAAVEAAKAAVLQAEVAQSRAEREHERAAQLKAAGLMTQQALDDAATAKDAAAAATAAARAQLRAYEARLDKTVIRAPMDGVVAYRGVNVGDRVENMGSDASMFRIVDNRLLELTVTVPSTRLNSLKIGQAVRFRTDAFADRTFTGSVSFINPSVDPANRSVKVIVDVRNDDATLQGGLFVKGEIVVDTRKGVLVIPRSALLRWDVEHRAGEVFVVSGARAERRSVTTGQTTGDAVEVASGLAEGDRVITRGAFNLNDGDPVKVATPAGA
jgi:RND family efflux transporter MFP subunit